MMGHPEQVLLFTSHYKLISTDPRSVPDTLLAKGFGQPAARVRLELDRQQGVEGQSSAAGGGQPEGEQEVLVLAAASEAAATALPGT